MPLKLILPYIDMTLYICGKCGKFFATKKNRKPREVIKEIRHGAKGKVEVAFPLCLKCQPKKKLA
ncbi:MAG: hypothetical protein V1900_03545 [Candidatus Aenigmatarchaeota archaeon]